MVTGFLLSRLASLFGGETVIGFMENLGAPVLAKAVGLVFIFFSLQVAAVTIRDFGELMVTVFYPETPIVVFIALMAFLTVWAIYSGLEVIARVAEFLLPLTVGGILLLGDRKSVV